MVNPTEGERTKPIRVIEYGRNIQGSIPFIIQAQNIFWERFDDRFILSPFARELAKSYVPHMLGRVHEYSHTLEVEHAYSRFKLISMNTVKQLSWIFTAANGEIKGKRILDLGCGSTGISTDSVGYFNNFEPWLCRTLSELGANPIGVDYGRLEGEKFEAHTKNLLEPDTLNFLDDNSVDIVHSRALFTSPQLHRLASWTYGLNFEDSFENSFMTQLRPQIERVLKPDGVFVYSKDL